MERRSSIVGSSCLRSEQLLPIPLKPFARRQFIDRYFEMINESMTVRRTHCLHYDGPSRIFSPNQVCRRAVASEKIVRTKPNEFAEGFDYFQKTAFPAVVWPDQNGKVAQLDRNVTQALVILDVNALEHQRHPAIEIVWRKLVL